MPIRFGFLAAILLAPIHARAAEIQLTCHVKALADDAPSTRIVVIDAEHRTITDNGVVFRAAAPSSTPGLAGIVIARKRGFFWGQREIATGRAMESFSVDLQTGDYSGDGWVSGPVARGTCVILKETS